MDHKDMFDESLDREWENNPADDVELKSLRSALKKRERKNLTRSVLSVILLLAVLFFAVVPGLEYLFWNPEQSTHDIEFTSDLELAMIAYSELFTPSQMVNSATYERTGFGTFSMSVCMYENFNFMVSIYNHAVFRFGETEFPLGFWRYTSANVFARASYPVYDLSEDTQQYYREKLEALPDYVQVRAAVSFPEDLNMEQFMEFAGSLEDAGIEWVGIRNSSSDQQRYPLCGMKPCMGGPVYNGLNEFYPEFDVKTTNLTPDALENHFKSLLQYSRDQIEAGRGIPVNGNYGDYYQDVLDYVEENGIMTYGCYVVCNAGQLLEMLDNGTAYQIWPSDAWIDI